MAMMISKFQRLIQSRLLWGFFLVIIVITFVFWGMFTGGGGAGAPEQPEVGQLNGRTVSRQEFQMFKDQIRLDLFLRTGQFPTLDEDLDRVIHNAVWERMAVQAEAEKLGFRASDADVRREIEAIPLFQENNRFSPDRYAMFTERVRENLGYGPRFFEEFIRNQITVQRHQSMMAQTVLVPPAEVERNARMLKDTFKVEYAELPLSLVADEIQVTPDVAQAYFMQNAERYLTPEKVRVQAVHFPASSLKAQVETPSEEDARDYYEDRPGDFMTTPAAPAAGDTNAVAAAAAPTRKPFEAVREEINGRLVEERAREKAIAQAYTFLDLLDSGKDGKPLGFDEAAAQLKLEIIETEPFARGTTPAGVEAGNGFAEAAFALDTKEESTPVSAPVPGNDGYYVLRFAERIEPQIPTWGDVSGPAMEDARRDAEEKAIRAKAEEFKTKVEEPGAVFADVAKAMGVEAKVSEPFALGDPLPPFKNASLIARAVIKLDKGGITEPIPAADGNMVIARVLERIPADAAKMGEIRGQILDYLGSERMRTVAMAWQKDLMADAKVEDLLAKRRAEAEAAEAGDKTGDEAGPAEAK